MPEGSFVDSNQIVSVLAVCRCELFDSTLDQYVRGLG